MNYPIIPYSPIIIDTTCKNLWYSALQCFCSSDNCRGHVEKKLQELWRGPSNPNHVMPLLSVRTGFDLFLMVKKYPPGSEIIMSAINIPDMCEIARSHGLIIIPLDISIDTLEPKLELLPKLITAKSVAIVVAHLYGRLINMDPFIDIAAQHGLAVIEDCAESFCGFENIGHPSADISLFSFGAIKFYTSLGGSIAKIRDIEMYEKMLSIHMSYPVQKADMYFKKVMKYIFIYSWLQVKPLPLIGRKVLNRFGVDYKSIFVKWMRGFPDKMIEMIRWQPSTALLLTMLHRHESFKQTEFNLQRLKAVYLLNNLPEGYDHVGLATKVNNFWLFPVLVEEPDTVVGILNVLGVDAYRGATQLNIIEPENKEELKTFFAEEKSPLNACYPHEAKYLIDHVIYLPVNKFIPFQDIDKMIKACNVALKVIKSVDKKHFHPKSKLLKSKL
ncbi:dTDP-3-amino-3,6-dideoxy-alpha-D-galactopyranose transaminase-like [Physella acuta]|uniref:dTDP-3-amino-3,6-dideoxy-alpha-D-galactopyranose transaminase-like n=1 Tax=Physella acuta TaxID=109671 RepID=UPI0027DCEA91|nr:dTDP-3-amino-3,6-dideoxy-alpha-D-galactopyranose transaminase-like [Physella acuta]XP_059167051.1 dTDP-3-amino-3,6-dideoxy-alpha-D-galactopyranose transaminase-like [Physella acuta]